MIDPGRLYTTAEVAAIMRVDRGTVSRWVRTGKLAAVRTPGAHARIRGAELQRTLER